jgi:hypothetical protein
LVEDGKLDIFNTDQALTMLAVDTRAREAGRRDADRSARPARAVQRLLAARFDGEVAGGAVADSF